MSGDTSDELDAVFSEMDRLADDFAAQADRNRQRREDAELEQRQDTVGDQPEREFDPEVFLLVPYDETDRRRPVPRRPRAAAPIRSSGVTVRRNGTPTVDIEPNADLSVECSIHNAGGLGAGTVTVELFVEHRERSVTVDTNANGEIEISSSGPAQDGDFTGFSTFSPNATRPISRSYDRLEHTPGDGLDPMGYVMYSGSEMTWENLLDVGRLESAHADPNTDVSPRAWRVRYGSKPQGYLVEGDPYRSNTFTIRIYDISLQPEEVDSSNFDVPPEWAAVYNTLGNPGDLSSIQYAADFLESIDHHTVLAEVDGRWVQGAPDNEMEQLNLTSTIDEASMEDRTQMTVPSGGSTTVELDYTAPPQQDGRLLTALYVRTYSLAPEDAPLDWEMLDHATSRFMGRSELYWPI